MATQHGSAPHALVVGGGPSGAACAIGLRRLGVDATLVAGPSANRRRPLETCGPELFRLTSEHGLDVSGADVGAPLAVYRSAWGAPQLEGRSVTFWKGAAAHLVDRARLDQRLREAARSAGAQVLEGTVHSASEHASGWTAGVDVGGRMRTIDADFVIEASGRRARSAFNPDVRRLLDDRLICIFADLDAGPQEDGCVTLEAGENGWWYCAPFGDGRSSVAFLSDADLVSSGAADVRACFERELRSTQHIRALVAASAAPRALHVCDARTSARRVLWRSRWVAVGDAAWSLDPLSGNGVARAVADGFEAAAAGAQFFVTGATDALRLHATQRANAYLQALGIRDRYYSFERRWPEASFWKRRRMTATDAAMRRGGTFARV